MAIRVLCVWHSMTMTAQHWMCFAKFYQASMLWMAHRTPSVNVRDFISYDFCCYFLLKSVCLHFHVVLFKWFELVKAHFDWTCSSFTDCMHLKWWSFWFDQQKLSSSSFPTRWTPYNRLEWFVELKCVGVQMIWCSTNFFINRIRCESPLLISLWFDLWSGWIVSKHLLRFGNTVSTDVSILLKNNKF